MIKSWKKVFESDLTNIMSEFKDSMAHPLVLFIEGPVGAGKTTFVKAFVQEERTTKQSYIPDFNCFSE